MSLILLSSRYLSAVCEMFLWADRLQKWSFISWCLTFLSIYPFISGLTQCQIPSGSPFRCNTAVTQILEKAWLCLTHIQTNTKKRLNLCNFTLWQIHKGRKQYCLVNLLLIVDHNSHMSMCWVLWICPPEETKVIICFLDDGSRNKTLMSPTDFVSSWIQQSYDDALIVHYLRFMLKKITHQ